MGQKTSCLGVDKQPSSEKIAVGGVRCPPPSINYEASQQMEPKNLKASNGGRSVATNSFTKGNVTKTRTTETDEEDDNVTDKTSGYILVDLKGDKIVHVEQDYLIGCEVQLILTCLCTFSWVFFFLNLCNF